MNDASSDEDTEDDYAYYTEEEYDMYHVDGAFPPQLSDFPFVVVVLC